MTTKKQTLVILDSGDFPAVYAHTQENARTLLVATLESRADLYDYTSGKLVEPEGWASRELKRKNVNLELLLNASAEVLDVKEYVRKVLVAVHVLDQDTRLSVDYIREVL